MPVSNEKRTPRVDRDKFGAPRTYQTIGFLRWTTQVDHVSLVQSGEIALSQMHRQEKLTVVWFYVEMHNIKRASYSLHFDCGVGEIMKHFPEKGFWKIRSVVSVSRAVLVTKGSTRLNLLYLPMSNSKSPYGQYSM